MQYVIVAGGRKFEKRRVLQAKLDALLAEIGPFCVVCGMAPGADTLGADWARANGLEVVEFPANWRPHGLYTPEAGKIRNRKMADRADMLVAFWDGHSTGTQDMIAVAQLRGMRVDVVRYEP